MSAEIKFIEQVPPDVEEIMSKGLADYETSHEIDVNYRKFALVLYGDNNEPLGVLNAYTAFSEVYIEDLWVDAAQRGNGYGRKLVERLEREFKGKGYNNINLVTSQFQAPEFYKKCGFQIEFVRKNFKNPKLTKTFFVKYFDDELQTQGILEK